MTTRQDHALWSDWCVVTGTSTDQRDEATLRKFAREASPSRRTLDRLRNEDSTSRSAPAWPLSTQHLGLENALHRLSRRNAHPDTHWVTRLRLRRLAFVTVLVAPVELGGLALNRQEMHDLTPTGLLYHRPSLETTTGEWSCPSCAVSSWLEVLGTAEGWSHHSVRALAHRPREQEASPHRCSRPDPDSDWLDCRRLLPAIDRWGYLDPYSSLHVSSISTLLQTLPLLVDQPVSAPEKQEIVAAPPATRTFTPEEEAEVFARADELNARMTRILNEA